MYLSTNSRPHIAYAVHYCAIFTHNTKNSHATGVNRTLRYLQGTKDEGIMLTPTKDLRVDYYIDADFGGIYSVEDNQDPTSVKSRYGYLITFI